MEPIKTFWLEPTKRVRRSLRRWSRAEGTTGFDCDGGYHTATADLPNTYTAKLVETDGRKHLTNNFRMPSHHDERWPTTCPKCGYEFTENDEWQANVDLLYRRTDTGDEMTLREAPAGATYDAWWFSRRGPDGICLAVICPTRNSPWLVDDRASNCGRPDDNVHYCWVRHGDPRECNVTVDKNGDTCPAGAGSIMIGGWHGFLRNGYLVVA